MDMSDTETSIARLLESYRAAVLERDAEAFLRLYEPDARVFDAWEIWSYEDSAAWRKAIEGWLGSLETERVEVSFQEVRTVDGGGLVLVSTFVTYASVSLQGEPLRSMQNRVSWVLRDTGHGLRIVHEHTSVPIDCSDSKAKMQRDATA
jgi:ketosteroid isomerase-like protein